MTPFHTPGQVCEIINKDLSLDSGSGKKTLLRRFVHLRVDAARAYGTVAMGCQAWEAESVRARQAPQARGRLAGKDATSLLREAPSG